MAGPWTSVNGNRGTCHRLTLTPCWNEERELLALARAGRGQADVARRARLILRAAAGATYASLAEISRTIAKWKALLLEAGIVRVECGHRGGIATVLPPALEARILAKTREAPPDGSTHWSTRTLARVLKLQTHTYVQRAWARAELQPHRIER